MFIVNPAAGNGKQQKILAPSIAAVLATPGISGEVYDTKGIGDAKRFVGAYPPGEVCFYAVSGDGTMNEIACGVMERGGGIVGNLPCGTGNDFVRLFDDGAAFHDVTRQIGGEPIALDLLKVNGEYAVNLCNMGIDAEVAAKVLRYKKWFPGPMAYRFALLRQVFSPLGQAMRITLDNGEIFEGKFLFASFANGRAYGGGFFAAPRALPDDGALEFCLARVISRSKLAALVKGYKAGRHLEEPAFQPIVTYRRCHSLLLELPAPASFCKDGEISIESRVEISVLPRALRFQIPAGVRLLPPL